MQLPLTTERHRSQKSCYSNSPQTVPIEPHNRHHAPRTGTSSMLHLPLQMLRVPLTRQVSSTRDICVLCATRQLATANAPSTHRRLLSSSSRILDAEAQLYKRDNAPAPAPARPLTQAERMRRALAASAPSPVAPPTTQRQPAQERRPSNRSGLFDGMGRDQRSAPGARRPGNEGRFEARPQRDRFRVNMDSRPAFDSPSFGSGHLRRRNEPQAEPVQAQQSQQTRQPARAVPSRGRLDQSELDKLLGNISGPSRPFQPLARNSNAQRKCFNCGSTGHMSSACPNKPTYRERPTAEQTAPSRPTTYQPPQSNQRTTMYRPAQAARESLADAANEWVSKRASKVQVEPQSYQAEGDWDSKRRDVEKERRRRRFEMDDEPTEV